MNKEFNWQENPPVISIGIHLEDDGWRFECPVCKEGFGPYEERGLAQGARGSHLAHIHGGLPFNAGKSPAAARRDVVAARLRRAAKRQE